MQLFGDIKLLCKVFSTNNIDAFVVPLISKDKYGGAGSKHRVLVNSFLLNIYLEQCFLAEIMNISNLIIWLILFHYNHEVCKNAGN